MIISRTPFRISFAGGGSDLPSFYREEQGAVLSTSIDKYMYLSMHRFFYPDRIQLKYSKTELVSCREDINHPIFRECLSMLDVTGVDINSIADIPAGTGLGSSSSFTVGLLNVLNNYLGNSVSKEYLASKACEVEIERLGEPIGKQDQYAAAYGGLNFITFNSDGTVGVERVKMDAAAREQLDRNLIMVYTGDVRSASDILRHQSAGVAGDDEKRATQRKMVAQAFELREVLERGAIDDFGRILHEGWMLKKTLAGGITNPELDLLYEQGLAAGALGGKLLGAGGGGFILFYCPQNRQEAFRKAMRGHVELDFRFEQSGSTIVYNA
jgi:D-glycero-alpha-D-manno-heptose-7-phosphate kinase